MICVVAQVCLSVSWDILVYLSFGKVLVARAVNFLHGRYCIVARVKHQFCVHLEKCRHVLKFIVAARRIDRFFAYCQNSKADARLRLAAIGGIVY